MKDHVTHHDDCGCQSAALKARIATLEAELAAVREASAVELVHAYAHAATLRDALEKTGCYCHHYGDDTGDGDGSCYTEDFICARCQALAQTPAASLAAHDMEVLERARWALNEAKADCECGNISALTTDTVIRALAAQEVKAHA